MRILRADTRQAMGKGAFHAQRVRPGTAVGPDADPAFGPLSVIDHATLDKGALVEMHEHNNDEILSYLWRGTMLHEDKAGHRVPISADKLMMMNAGKSFWHEESVPDEPVEMLQILIRPTEADLPASVGFHDRPHGAPEGAWGLVAGPEGSGAPLTIRNAVRFYDVRLRAGQGASVPAADGLSPWLYVLDGAVEVGGERLGKGDAAGDAGEHLPPVRAETDAMLVLFLVDRAAPASKAGTISGR